MGHSAAGDRGFDLSNNTRGQTSGRDESRCTINVQRTVETLELLRFQNRLFRFETVLRKNRGFGTDFDNRNKTRIVTLYKQTVANCHSV